MNDSNRDPQATDGAQTAGPPVQDRSIRPPGVLPKNTQTYIILGIAVLMVGAIAFSGAGTPPSNPATALTKTPTAVDPNWARIQEYRNRIDEQARKLADEQAKLEQAKQAYGLPPGGTGPTPTQVGPGYAYPPPVYQQPEPRPPAKPEKSAIEADQEKREYQSLFASNVALSFRREGNQVIASLPNGGAAQGAPLSTPAVSSTSLTPQPTREAETEESEATAQDTPRNAGERRKRKLPTINQANGQLYRLFEGT